VDKISAILIVLMTLGFAIVIAPGIFALNRGKVLNNIALWLAIFAALALFYRHFGPGSDRPIFSGPSVTLERGGKKTFPDNSDAHDTDNSKIYICRRGIKWFLFI
jgi:hypothetical protein